MHQTRFGQQRYRSACLWKRDSGCTTGGERGADVTGRREGVSKGRENQKLTLVTQDDDRQQVLLPCCSCPPSSSLVLSVHGVRVAVARLLDLLEVLEDDVVQSRVVVPQLTHHQSQAQELLFIQLLQPQAPSAAGGERGKRSQSQENRDTVRKLTSSVFRKSACAPIHRQAPVVDGCACVMEPGRRVTRSRCVWEKE